MSLLYQGKSNAISNFPKSNSVQVHHQRWRQIPSHASTFEIWHASQTLLGFSFLEKQKRLNKPVDGFRRLEFHPSSNVRNCCL